METKDLKATEEILEEVSKTKGNSISAITVGVLIVAGIGTISVARMAYNGVKKGYQFIIGKADEKKQKEEILENVLDEDNFEDEK